VRTIRLHDTRPAGSRCSRPRDPGRIGIYACGPTVYNRIHVGNARPFVVHSLLQALPGARGYDVTLVANVTDVNDKIYDAARRLDPPVPSERLAREMTAQYLADTDRLGLGRPDHEPLASETIGPIVELIQALIDGGSAYAVQGRRLLPRALPTPSTARSRTAPSTTWTRARASKAPDLKEDPLDFALWKAHKEGEDTAWDAPWGPRPARLAHRVLGDAEELLGVGFDIHGGGNDLTFPHHENEAAQTGLPAARS